MFCIKMTVASLVNNWQAQNQYWLSNMIFYSATQHQFLKLFIKILKWVYEKILNKSVIIFNSKVLPWSVLFWQLSTSILEAYLCIMARVLLFKTHITTAVESACRVVSSHLMISQDFSFRKYTYILIFLRRMVVSIKNQMTWTIFNRWSISLKKFLYRLLIFRLT